MKKLSSLWHRRESPWDLWEYFLCGGVGQPISPEIIQKQQGWQQGRCICKHIKSTKSLLLSQKVQGNGLEWVTFGQLSSPDDF